MGPTRHGALFPPIRENESDDQVSVSDKIRHRSLERPPSVSVVDGFKIEEGSDGSCRLRAAGAQDSLRAREHRFSESNTELFHHLPFFGREVALAVQSLDGARSLFSSHGFGEVAELPVHVGATRRRLTHFGSGVSRHGRDKEHGPENPVSEQIPGQ